MASSKKKRSMEMEEQRSYSGSSSPSAQAVLESMHRGMEYSSGHPAPVRHRSVQEEELLRLYQQSVAEREQYYQECLRMSSALQQKQHEVQELHRRHQQEESILMSRLEENNEEYSHRFHNMRSALDKKAKEVEFLKDRNTEVENFYRKKVSEAKAALKQKDEELQSFKDRVVKNVGLSMKTGKLESMENPVSRSRLQEMYNELKVQWPRIKRQLKAKKESSESVKALIQTIFSDASENMEHKKSQINEVFGLNDPDSGPVPRKVHEYRQSTIQYLQLTLYQKRLDETGSKTPFIQYDDESSMDVKEYLIAQCRWLGCLMALNDPSLQPDWENHESGMDTWDILPRNIKPHHTIKKNPQRALEKDPNKDPGEEHGKDPEKAPGKETENYPGKDYEKEPKNDPTKDPEKDPTEDPRKEPGKDPNEDPRKEPEKGPNEDPRKEPEKGPNEDPRKEPEKDPTEDPRKVPEKGPTEDPRKVPEKDPTEDPRKVPEKGPTEDPRKVPEKGPTEDPRKKSEKDPKRYPGKAVYTPNTYM